MTLTNFPNGIKTSEVVTGGSGGTSASIVFATADATGNTGSVTVESGDSSGGNSGDVTIATGSASGTRGTVIMDAPTFSFPAPGATFTFGDATDGPAYFTTGFSGGSSGGFGIQSNDIVAASGTSGGLFFGTGQAGASSGNSGTISLYTGDAAAGTAGDILLSCGSGSDTSHSGHILLQSGKDVTINLIGSARAIILGLPTSDPHVVGALWIDAAASRVIKSSNG